MWGGGRYKFLVKGMLHCCQPLPNLHLHEPTDQVHVDMLSVFKCHLIYSLPSFYRKKHALVIPNDMIHLSAWRMKGKQGMLHHLMKLVYQLGSMMGWWGEAMATEAPLGTQLLVFNSFVSYSKLLKTDDTFCVLMISDFLQLPSISLSVCIICYILQEAAIF